MRAMFILVAAALPGAVSAATKTPPDANVPPLWNSAVLQGIRDAKLGAPVLIVSSVPGIFGQAVTHPSTDPFSIVISAAKTEVKAGELISVRVRLINTSEHEINASSARSRGVDQARGL